MEATCLLNFIKVMNGFKPLKVIFGDIIVAVPRFMKRLWQ